MREEIGCRNVASRPPARLKDAELEVVKLRGVGSGQVVLVVEQGERVSRMGAQYANGCPGSLSIFDPRIKERLCPQGCSACGGHGNNPVIDALYENGADDHQGPSRCTMRASAASWPDVYYRVVRGRADRETLHLLAGPGSANSAGSRLGQRRLSIRCRFSWR